MEIHGERRTSLKDYIFQQIFSSAANTDLDCMFQMQLIAIFFSN